jgi:hypothetical protein
MKILKYNFPLLLFSIICTITISTQAQTLYWHQLTPGYYIYDMLYDGQQNLYFSGSNGNYYFWRTTDLGQTWTRFGNGNLRLYRIAMDSSGVLWGGCDPNGGIYKSTNQGETWTNTLPTNERIFSITVSPNNWIWAGTYDGKVVYSSNHGNTWEKDTLASDIMWSIATNKLNHIFTGNANGEIYRTTDLGNSWELVYNVPPLTVMGIVIDDSNHIYANKWTNRLISYDNGNTWNSIPGPQLERLYIDKYHGIYSGPLGHRSLDNCVSWTLIGPTNPSFVYTYAFVDSLIFAGTTNGVYLHDPSFHPYIGDNYFPLAVGNKWQFNRMCYIYFSGNTEYYVDRDTIISNKKYYHIQGEVNDWVRYDNEEDKFYLRWNDNDYVVMDYTLNEGSSTPHILFNTHEIKSAWVVAPMILSIFDSTFHSKGNSWGVSTPIGGYGYKTYYSERLGETKQNYYSSPGFDCERTMIRAIIHDSIGVKYYSDHVKPEIIFSPVLVTNKFNIDWDFDVDHLYTGFRASYNENFVDSVLMYSYYSNEDSIFSNAPVLAINTPNSINYSISHLLDSTLMKNDYSFYYKIYAVDKGIVPEYSTKPDTGYYKLVYDPNVSVEIIEDRIMDYELLQNYPNPFNPVTVIDYSIKEEGNVELIVYDVLGKVVEKLVEERKIAGNYSSQFDASKLSSGIYFYSLRVNDFVATKKMLLIK